MGKKTIWAVVDNNTSKALPSAKTVVAKFDTLKEADAFVGAASSENWSIRQFNPTGRRRKDDEDEQ